MLFLLHIDIKNITLIKIDHNSHNDEVKRSDIKISMHVKSYTWDVYLNDVWLNMIWGHKNMIPLAINMFKNNQEGEVTVDACELHKNESLSSMPTVQLFVRLPTNKIVVSLKKNSKNAYVIAD